MNKIKGKIAVLLFISILVPYLEISQTNESANGISRVKAETISDETEWNIKYMNAEKSYEESVNLKKIKVAVLDSGLDYDEDIPFVERKDFLGEEELHPIYQDYTGHGTSVAGLICAKKSDDRITGIAANVDLYAGRILDAENKAPVGRVIEGIEWAIEKKVNIIHMSYGTQESSQELEEVINKAYNEGILLIAAAGNSGTAAEDESTVEYPAAFDNVISVGATNVENKKTEISSSGYELDVVAPGDQILSSGAFGGVVVEEGTSVSAAQVTGLAAVLWGKHPDKSNEFIKGLLVSGANAEAVDENCGNGIVDYEQSKQNYEKMNHLYCACKKEGLSEKDAVKRAEMSMGKNTKEIREQEVNYVNGAWSGKDHMGFVSNVDYINIVKNGAVYPDKVESMKGMGEHPYFHGRGNYLANTQYIYATAKAYIYNPSSKDSLTVNDVYGKHNPLKGIKEGGRKDVKKYLNRVLPDLWAFYRKNHIDVSTDKKKGYALLGVAIHNATDAMSHSACIDLGQYGGWQKVVHPANAVAKSKQNKCAAYLFEVWSADEQLEPLKTVASHWKRLVIADNTKKLKPFLKLSDEIAKLLISYMKKQEQQCYGCFAVPVNHYWKNKPDETLRLADLNENWGEVTAGNGKFGISKRVVNYEVEKVKKSDVRVYNQKEGMRVTLLHSSPYMYYRVSRGGTKRTYYKQNGKGRNAYWFIPGGAGKINVQTCSIQGTKERTMIRIAGTVQFSRKNLKGVKGKIKKKNLKLGQTFSLPKKGFTKKGYKITKWYRFSNGNPIYYKIGRHTCTSTEDVTFYPYFEKKKKG